MSGNWWLPHKLANSPTAPPTGPPVTPPTASEPTSPPTPTEPSTTTAIVTTTLGRGCHDNDVLCPIWASLGYCVGEHDDHMALHCQLSCRTCPGDAHRTPPRNDNDGDPVTSTTQPLDTTTTQPQGDVCHFTECGRSDRCSQPAACVTDEQLHEVRCCSDAAIDGWKAASSGGRSVWGESDDTSEGWACTSNAPFSRAQEICTSVGARLCTAQELRDDVTAATGCNHDSDLIWTSNAGRTSALAEAPALSMDAGSASFDSETTSTVEPTTVSHVDEADVELAASSGNASTDVDAGTSAGAIAGAVIGTVLLVVVMAAVVVLQRQRRVATAKHTDDDPSLRDGQLDSIQSLSVSDAAIDSTFEAVPGANAANLRLVSVRRGNPAFRESVIPVSDTHGLPPV